MPTRLFFHDAPNSQSGSFPSTELSATDNTVGAVSPVGSNTLRTMNNVIGVAQTSLVASAASTISAQSIFFARFCSLPLQGNQTVGGGTMTLNTADREANANANFWINALNVFVWRPSTGTLVGIVRDAANVSLGGLESSATANTVTHIPGITSSAVSAQNGDVIICEVWSRFTQATAAVRAVTFFYDGTTVNTTENAIVTSHASFIEFTENISFKTGAIRSFNVMT